MDLAQELPSTVQLHGYDISAEQFPPRSLWPENVSLETLNALEELPPHVVGYYDVVHVRMWASNLRDRDASILIRNLSVMLSKGHQLDRGSEDAMLTRL